LNNALFPSSPFFFEIWTLHLLVFFELTNHPCVMTWQGKAVLQWFAAMASRLGAVGVQPYLRSILAPLYKITEGSAAKQVQGMILLGSRCIILQFPTLSF
jgi:hypothetical protein